MNTFECPFCGNRFMDRKSYALHLSIKERHNFKDQTSLIKHKLIKFSNTDEGFLEKLISEYLLGESKNTLLNRTGIDITELLESMNKKRTPKEAHNTHVYKERFIKSIKDKYGVDNVSQVQEIKDKKRQTVFNRYGVINSYLIPNISDRRKKALESLFNDKERMKLKWDKIVETWERLFGVRNISCNQEIAGRISHTKKETFFSMTSDEKFERTVICRRALAAKNLRMTDKERRDLFLKRTKGLPYESTLEKRVHSIIDQMGIKYVKHIFFKGLNYDICIDNYLFIEVHGDYWHANPLLYKEHDKFFNGRVASDIWKKDAMKKNSVEKNSKAYECIWECQLNAMSNDDIKIWVLNILNKHIDGRIHCLQN